MRTLTLTQLVALSALLALASARALWSPEYGSIPRTQITDPHSSLKPVIRAGGNTNDNKTPSEASIKLSAYADAQVFVNGVLKEKVDSGSTATVTVSVAKGDVVGILAEKTSDKAAILTTIVWNGHTYRSDTAHYRTRTDDFLSWPTDQKAHWNNRVDKSSKELKKAFCKWDKADEVDIKHNKFDRKARFIWKLVSEGKGNKKKTLPAHTVHFRHVIGGDNCGGKKQKGSDSSDGDDKDSDDDDDEDGKKKGGKKNGNKNGSGNDDDGDEDDKKKGGKKNGNKNSSDDDDDDDKKKGGKQNGNKNGSGDDDDDDDSKNGGKKDGNKNGSDDDDDDDDDDDNKKKDGKKDSSDGDGDDDGKKEDSKKGPSDGDDEDDNTKKGNKKGSNDGDDDNDGEKKPKGRVPTRKETDDTVEKSNTKDQSFNGQSDSEELPNSCKCKPSSLKGGECYDMVNLNEKEGECNPRPCDAKYECAEDGVTRCIMRKTHEKVVMVRPRVCKMVLSDTEMLMPYNS